MRLTGRRRSSSPGWWSVAELLHPPTAAGWPAPPGSQEGPDASGPSPWDTCRGQWRVRLCNITHNTAWRWEVHWWVVLVKQPASSETSGQVKAAVHLLSGQDYSLKCWCRLFIVYSSCVLRDKPWMNSAVGNAFQLICGMDSLCCLTFHVILNNEHEIWTIFFHKLCRLHRLTQRFITVPYGSQRMTW